MGVEPIPYEKTAFGQFYRFLTNCIDIPVTWFRENVVLPNRQDYAWYHEQLRRVPTIDECYKDDPVCVYEADIQFQRDRLVDKNIVRILRKRYENCLFDNEPDEDTVCAPLHDAWQKAMTNFFIKYGDLGYCGGALAALMKQKHRMVWERRHGSVGSGMSQEKNKDKISEQINETC